MATDQKVFIYSPELEQGGYPPDCPFNSKRAGKTLETIKTNGLIQSNDRRVLPAEALDRATLERFHTAAKGQFHVFRAKLGVHEGSHVGIQDVHHLVQRLHHGHENTSVVQIFGHL